MNAVYTLGAVLLCLVLGLGYLFVRYLQINFGLKDSNYGAVQHSRKELPPPSVEDLFLPGSYMEQDKQKMLEKRIQETPEIEQITPKKKKKRIFRSKEDILRAYIADAILDKPKWSEKQEGNS